MVTNTHDDRADWDTILRYLVSVAHDDALIEWHGKRWFYTQPDGINRGILMLPERAPVGTPIIRVSAELQLDAAIAEVVDAA